MATPSCHSDRPYFAKGVCKNCYHKQWVQEHPIKNRQYRKKWVGENGDKVRELRRLGARRATLRKFDLTLGDVDEILEEQNGVCAICLRPPSTRSLSIDQED